MSFRVSFVGGAGECGSLKYIYLVCICVHACVWGPCMYIANVAVEGQLLRVRSLLPYRWISLCSVMAHSRIAGSRTSSYFFYFFSHHTVRILTLQMPTIASGFLCGSRNWTNSSGLGSKDFYLVSHLHSPQNQGIGSRLPGLLFWSHHLTRYVIWPVSFMPLPLVFLSVKWR